MQKGSVLGGLAGILPGIQLIYVSTIDTGQTLPIELPLGLTVTAFYLILIGYILYKKRKITRTMSQNNAKR